MENNQKNGNGFTEKIFGIIGMAIFGILLIMFL